MRDFPERDWKILRDLKDVAVERICKRALDEVAKIATGLAEPPNGYHERYRALFALLRKRDKEIADTFDGLRRSTALQQLALMRHHQLFTDEEFLRFSQQTRESVQAFLSIQRT